MKLSPMLAETASEAFDCPDWLFEQKLDGVRCVAYLGSNTELQSRSFATISHKFPELADLHRQAAKPCVLDGEIVCPTFNQMQQRIHKERPLDIRIASRQKPATFYAFDIISFDGQDLTAKPLTDRKIALAHAFKHDERGRILSWQTGEGKSLFAHAAEAGLEGIMAKRLKSTYQAGRRSPDWLKIKAFREARFLIVGITEGENARASTFGSLILAQPTEDGLKYAGNVGSGFSEAMLASLVPVFEGLRAECPFPKVPDVDREVKLWLRPFLWCEVRFLEWSADGKLRFPTFRKLVSGCC